MGNQYETHSFGVNDAFTVEDCDTFINLYFNGELRVTMDIVHNEITTYREGLEEPAHNIPILEGDHE